MAKNLNRKVQIYINDGEVKNTLKSIRDEVVRLEREQRKLIIDSDEYVAHGKKIAELKAYLQAAKVDVEDLGNTWERTTQRLAEFSNILMGVQSAFQMLDIGIGKVKDLASDAAKLDDIYADVQKTTGLTHDEVEKLNEAFKKMDTRTSREQLNQLAYEAGKLGISGTEAVLQFVRASDKINVALGDVLGDGAMVTVGKMADVYTGSTKALADAGDDLEKKMLALGSAVNQLGQESTANEHYLVDFTARMGGIAVQAGLSADQVLGFASALDQDMQMVEMSATAFQKFIGQIMKKPAEFARQAGMDVKSFSDLVRTDLNSALMKVLEGFQGKGGYAELVNVFKDLGLDGARAASVISAMANSIDKITEAQAIANVQLRERNSIENEFDVKNNNRQAQREKALKAFNDTRIALGNELYPVLIHLQKTGTVLMKGVAGFIQLASKNKAVLIGVLALLARWTQLMLVNSNMIGKLGKSLKSLIGIDKLSSHQQDVSRAKILKRTAAEEKERLATIKNELAKEKKIAQMKVEMYDYDGLTRKMIAQERVRDLQTMQQRQATIATNAHTNAIRAQKAAFASTPWGLIITALTTIAAVTINAVKNSQKWKLNETMREVAKECAEAQWKIDDLFNTLRKAKEGSEEYNKALAELKTEYPEIIQKHSDEAGRLRDIEQAYKDVSAAAKNSIYERIRAEKSAEAYGDAAYKTAKNMEGIHRLIDQYADNEAQRLKVTQQINGEIEKMTSGLETSGQAVMNMRNILRDAGGDMSKIGNLLYDHFVAIAGYYNQAKKIEAQYQSLLSTKPKNEYEGKTRSELKAELKSVGVIITNLQNQMRGLDDKSRKKLQATIKNFIDIRKQILEALKTAPETKPKTTTGNNNNNGGFSGGESAAERKARERREREEAAWSRFEDSYNRLIEKMNAKSLTGAEKVLADVDNAIAKMNDDLALVLKKHPEAQKMMDDLQEKAVQWKKEQIDAYIKKMNDELTKQQNKLKETDAGGNEYINKMKEAQRRLIETFTTFDNAISRAQIDIASLEERMANAADAERENLQNQINQLKELIKQYGILKGQTQARVFDSISTSNVKATRLSGDDTQWRDNVQEAVGEKQRSGLSMLFNKSDFAAYGKALESIWQKYDKQKKAIEDARAANATMLKDLREKAAKDPENEELKEKIRLREEEERRLEAETTQLEKFKDTALAAAEEDAFGNAINRWIDGIEKFGSMATELLGNVNTILNNIAQKELNEAQKEKEANEDLLKEQLDNGIITQEEYNEQVDALNKEYDAKEKEIQLEQWRREKALNIGKATMEGALAVLKALASAPPPYNAILAAIAGGLAAVQIAAIATEPEPYARGGYVEKDTTFYRAGEKGREWVASNSLLQDPATAPIIEQLEAYQRGNHRALADIPMATLDFPAAAAAAKRIGDRQVMLRSEAASTLWEHPTATSMTGDNHEMVSILRELTQYLEDPQNRQAVITRKTMTTFEDNESFLRELASV